MRPQPSTRPTSAGPEYGDVITAIAGQPATVDSFGAFSRRKPGESAALTVQRRGRQTLTTTITLEPNPALMVTPKTGPASKMSLDPDTYLLLRTIAKVQSPEVGEFEQVSEPSDYRDVDGVKVPFTIVTTSPMQTVTIKLAKVEHNVAIDDALFSVK